MFKNRDIEESPDIEVIEKSLGRELNTPESQDSSSDKEINKIGFSPLPQLEEEKTS